MRLQRTSIFETNEQLENLGVIIERNIARLEGANDEACVKYVGELRQCIQLAIQVAEKMANYERYTVFQKTVFDILMAELPQRRAEILEKIRTAGQAPQILNPLSPAS